MPDWHEVRMPLQAPRGRAPRARRRRASRGQRAPDARVDLRARRLTRDVRWDDVAAAVDEERLGDAGDAPLRPGAAERIADVQVGDAVVLEVRPRRPFEVLRIHAEEDDV